jgi:hypothetical protein
MAHTEDWNHWAGSQRPALYASDIDPCAPLAEIPLPNYIKAPDNINSDDLEYLWNEGALTIPHTFLKNALLLAYVEYVHPSLPLINLHELLATTCANITHERPREDKRISLLLFQAIMFTGSAFVDQISLQMAGYSSRREARAILYQKVKVSAQSTCQETMY